MKLSASLSLLISVIFLGNLVNASTTAYDFKEQKRKGFIWSGEKFISVNNAEDLVKSFFYEDSVDKISLALFKMIRKNDEPLFDKILNIQNSFVKCKVSQHVGPGEITVYIGDRLSYIDGNGTSFNSVADDQYIGLHIAKEDGTYQYVTVLGATKTIGKYKVINIEDEKKQLLDYYLLRAYLNGVRQDILNGYMDISYCTGCSTCKDTSIMKCADCNGSGEIENHKVASEKRIKEEVEEVVEIKMKRYKVNYQKKRSRINSSGRGHSSGDALALEKDKEKLEQQEYRLREMTTERIMNKKVPCPFCATGKVLCSAHKYESVNYKKEYAHICDSRKNK